MHAEGNAQEGPAILPSERYPDALSALDELIVDGALIRTAVAFVTEPGVRLLRGIVEQRVGVRLEVAARAADATTPEALVMLWHEVGAEVSIVLGKHASAFHPKLWLIETGEELHVLSGSGNLTSAGLRGNDEQFELYTVPAGGAAAAAQAARFDRLVTNALPLDTLYGGATWGEWLALIKKQRVARSELERLGRQLAARDPQPDRTADKAVLLEDLEDLYRRTLAAKLPKEDGGTYNPGRFRQQISRAQAGNADPVGIVTGICRRRTPGFDVIFESGRQDLTVESLVVDISKPYHDLFSDRTRSLCAQRMRAFDAAGGNGALMTQAVTEADIQAGLIRVPVGPAKELFPSAAGAINVNLRGIPISASWNPNWGTDRERSGRIGIGVERARTLLAPGKSLEITGSGDLIRLT